MQFEYFHRAYHQAICHQKIILKHLISCLRLLYATTDGVFTIRATISALVELVDCNLFAYKLRGLYEWKKFFILILLFETGFLHVVLNGSNAELEATL